MILRCIVACTFVVACLHVEALACDEEYSTQHGTLSSNAVAGLASCRWTIHPSSMSQDDQVFIELLLLNVDESDGSLRIFDGLDNSAFLLFDSDHIELPAAVIVDQDYNMPSVRSSNKSLHVEYVAHEGGSGAFDLRWTVKPDRQLEAVRGMRPYFQIDPWESIDETLPLCSQTLPGLKCAFNTVVEFSTFGSTTAGDLNGTLPEVIELFDELSALALDLISTALPESLKSMEHLQTIICDSCTMTEFPTWIKDLPRLKSFSFRASPEVDNEVDNVLPTYITSPHVHLFLCVECRLSGSLAALSSLGQLEFLDLESNRFAGALPEFSSTSLKHLALSGNAFTGAIPESYRSLYLSDIDLSQNQLSGTFPRAGFPTSLKVFDVGANNFTGQIPSDWFDTFSSLADFKAGDNPLTCPVRDYSMLAARTDTAWYADDGSITCTGGELAVLREVALALGASSSWNVSWNFSDGHYCQFDGITCERPAGEVTEIDLTGFGIRGIPPASLETLGLRSLHLSSSGLFCPLVDYSDWADETDYTSSNPCFECSISDEGIDESSVRSTNTDGCSEHDFVGEACHLECAEGMRAFAGSATLVCGGVEEGYNISALQCKPGCSPPELESVNIVASPDCTNMAEGALCELQCAEHHVLASADSLASLAPLECLRESDGFGFGELTPQACAKPCSFTDSKELSDRNIEISEGCLSDKHGDICMLQCTPEHDLVVGSLELVCHFESGAFAYTGTAPKCFQSDKRYGMAVFGALGFTALVAWCASCWSNGPNAVSSLLLAALTATHITCSALFVSEAFTFIENGQWALQLVIASLCIPFASNLMGLVFYLSQMPEVVDSMKNNIFSGIATLVLSCVNIEFLRLWAPSIIDPAGDSEVVVHVMCFGWPMLRLLGAMPFVVTTLPLVFVELFLMSAGEVPPSTLFYMAMSTTLFMLGAGFAKMASLPPQEADTDNEVDCIDNEPTTVYDIDSEVEAAEVKECRSTGAGFANSAGIGKPSAAGVHRSKSAAHAFEVGISAKPRVSVPGVQTMRRDQQGNYGQASNQRPPPSITLASMGRRLSQAVQGVRTSIGGAFSPRHHVAAADRRWSASGQSLLRRGRFSSVPNIEPDELDGAGATLAVSSSGALSPRSPLRTPRKSIRIGDVPLSPLRTPKRKPSSATMSLMATVAEEDTDSAEIKRITNAHVKRQSIGKVKRKTSGGLASPHSLDVLHESDS